MALIVGLLAVGLVAAKRGDWEKVFVPAGQRLLAGQDIFQTGYVYPPFQALLAAPFAAMPQRAARMAWASLNAVAAAVFLIGAWRLTGGRSHWKREKLPRAEWWIFTLGIAAAIAFVFDAITNGQTDLLIAAALTSGCLLAPRSGAGGGALIGIAAGAKCTPLLFFPWLVFRGRWKAALCLVAVALAINLLPDVIFPNAGGGLRLMQWAHTFFAPLFDQNYAVGTWYTAPEFNHSLAGFFQRLLPAAIVRPIWIFTSAALLLFAAWTVFRGRKNAPAVRTERFEIGMIVCLMLLLSPASSKPHFCVLLLAAWAVARAAFARRDRLLLASSIAAALAGLLVNKDLVGATIYDAAKWWGLITLETVLLFVACSWAHLRRTNLTALPDDCVDLNGEGR